MKYKGHSNCASMFAYGYTFKEFKNNLDELEEELDKNNFIVEDIKFATDNSRNYTAMFIVRRGE